MLRCRPDPSVVLSLSNLPALVLHLAAATPIVAEGEHFRVECHFPHRPSARQALLARGMRAQDMAMIDRMPSIATANYAFRNNGNLNFENAARAW